MPQDERESKYEFEKNFVRQLFNDELVFILNGKNKIEEWRSQLNIINDEIKSENWDENKGPILEKEVNRIYTFIQVFFQELLKINNISFLVGAGSSIPFGSKSIRDINEMELELSSGIEGLYETLKSVFIEKSEETGKSTDFESFLGFLYMLKLSVNYSGKIYDFKNPNIKEKIEELIKEIKKEFIEKYCKPPYPTNIQDGYPKEEHKRYSIHQKFIRKILARPSTLRRPNIFTLNYDLMFEKALDKLGVIYLDGFIGTSERAFRPDSYNIDFYYPATTTEGKVSRLDKVLHLYKLHGSIDWLRAPRTSSNIFGILKKNPSREEGFGDVLIYPTPMKEGETLGFPYSELFRRFANIIQQPQSVLVTIGYSFSDEHINRIIWEAFSIPSFNLVIVGYRKKGIENIMNKFDGMETRITFIAGESFGDFKNFVERVLPDYTQMEIEEKIKRTLDKLLPEMEKEIKEGR